ncbi:MAG: FkbM family methyltransferase [Ignavibacteriales bacterium]|nr:FkbM family methyltransferase [Ignavibacteriales bacterium]
MIIPILKRKLSDFLRYRGYQISKIHTLENNIIAGKFIWLQKMGIKTVLDVGANVGNFTKMISKILGNVNIYAFEPLGDCYKNLIENTKHIENIKCFNSALGNSTATSFIYHNEFSPSSSLLRMEELHKNIFPHTKNEITEKIEVRELDSFENEINWTRKILLKIDVQGFELNVLKGAIISLKKIDVIILEISFVKFYENQTNFDEIYRFLSEMNFNFQGNFDQVKDPKTGKILYVDAIFIKD